MDMQTRKPIATRYSFGKSIIKYAKENQDIVVLEADLGKSTQSFFFNEKFPKRYFQLGIAEANMIGIGAGLAFSGKIPFICSFAVFLTGCYDKIRMSIAYPKANVKMIGTHSGVATGSDGNSQQALEDISIMRSLHNMIVVQPCDDIEAEQLIYEAIKIQGPVFIRLSRQEVPIIHSENYVYQFGMLDIIKNGSDVIIFASGSTVSEALDASKKIENLFSYSVAVINVHTLKPIDHYSILNLVKNKKMIISVEDHYIIGGLGSIIAETISELKSHPPLYRIGINSFGESASKEELYEKFKINSNGILEIFSLHKKKCFT